MPHAAGAEPLVSFNSASETRPTWTTWLEANFSGASVKHHTRKGLKGLSRRCVGTHNVPRNKGRARSSHAALSMTAESSVCHV